MNQEKALAILQSGRNVFLTGCAGSGKTYLLQKYIGFLRKKKIPLAITASTGIAATHLGGQTIHSWSGLGIREQISDEKLRSLYKIRYLRKSICKTQVLIIDEISMLHKNQLECIDRILRFFKGIDIPFGGLQTVFSGDFFQLPPVCKDNQPSRMRFCFMSEIWKRLNLSICYLQEQHRQNDEQLTQLLNAIRQNHVSAHMIATLKKTAMQTDGAIKLFTHNEDIDRINNEKLKQLPQNEHRFTAITTGNQRAVERLKKSILAPEKLVLKKEAKVLFIKNNPTKGYMNGTLGEITGFSTKGNPKVQTKNSVITVEPEIWQEFDEDGKVTASYNQIPLRLAWAITIHKSQGMTLDSAYIDLSKAFEPGQGYVALSRLPTIHGLALRGINAKALQVDDLSLRADSRFQELSQQEDTQSTLDTLKQESATFITTCRKSATT